tara:strand:- start:210 stop:458 length:249 start_codon:yes stop_codon:yes gene_type:complete
MKDKYVIVGKPWGGYGQWEVACTRAMTKKTAEKKLELYNVGGVPNNHYDWGISPTGYYYKDYAIQKLKDGQDFNDVIDDVWI